MSEYNDMMYKIGLWLVKQLTETNADNLTYTLEDVTDPSGKQLGNFVLRFTKEKK